jgi:alpha-beta hydrolase superfamily lysophospholipase
VTVSWTVEQVAGPSGNVLATRHWPAAGRRKLASVLIVHGLGEHSGRYDHVARRLAANGIDVHGFDLRGFGASGGRRAWLQRWSDYHDDVEARLLHVRDLARGRPVALYGHSLGGLVALGYVMTDRPKPDLLVLTAPALDSDLPGWKRALARVLSGVAPRLQIRNGFDGSVLSRDPAVAAAYLADPLNYSRTTARLADEAMREQERVNASLDRLTVPTLVLHGGQDTLIPGRASEPLAGLPGVTRIVYDGLRHEVHNEPEWESVLEDVLVWLRQNLPPTVPKAPRAPRSKIEEEPNIASGERTAR